MEVWPGAAGPRGCSRSGSPWPRSRRAVGRDSTAACACLRAAGSPSAAERSGSAQTPPGSVMPTSRSKELAGLSSGDRAWRGGLVRGQVLWPEPGCWRAPD